MRATQTLQVGGDPAVVVDSLPSVRAPARLVSGDHYCQILMMRNPIVDPIQLARIIELYNSGEVAILLELKLRYYDAFTEKEFFVEERNTVKKDRVCLAFRPLSSLCPAKVLQPFTCRCDSRLRQSREHD